jgi:hypothetical protein
VRRKWRHHLPIVSPCTLIKSSPWAVVKEVIGSYKGAMLRHGRVGSRVENPAALHCSLMVSELERK